MRLYDLLYRAPAWVLLVLPFLAAGLILAFVLSFFPAEATARYMAFALVFFAILLSRMLRVWEWGVEVFHFLTFCIVLAYGFVFGAVLTVAMSALVLYLLFNARAHYFTYGAASILIQSLGLLVNVALAGALSFLAPGISIQYSGTGVVFIALLLDKFLTNRFVGIGWGRLSASLLVDVVLNYNLFSLFGAALLSFLSGV